MTPAVTKADQAVVTKPEQLEAELALKERNAAIARAFNDIDEIIGFFP